MKPINDGYQLSTGKVIDTDGRGSLSPQHHGRLLFGSDGMAEVQFTDEERAEIAEHMIEVWRLWGLTGEVSEDE